MLDRIEAIIKDSNTIKTITEEETALIETSQIIIEVVDVNDSIRSSFCGTAVSSYFMEYFDKFKKKDQIKIAKI